MQKTRYYTNTKGRLLKQMQTLIED
uniref:Uncharacterized protein n=1 Tax=Rhizophora mucronata TaxID=61149 RepID=A0A2P2QM16_RHIMU